MVSPEWWETEEREQEHIMINNNAWTLMW